MPARKFYEHHKRSLAKSISYRILILIASYLLIFNITGDPTKSLNYSISWNIIGLVIYFLHERLWNRIHWGKQ